MGGIDNAGGAVAHYKLAVQLYTRHLGQGHPSVERATQRLAELGHAAQ
jgi:hypothetical protein